MTVTVFVLMRVFAFGSVTSTKLPEVGIVAPDCVVPDALTLPELVGIMFLIRSDP